MIMVPPTEVAVAPAPDVPTTVIQPMVTAAAGAVGGTAPPPAPAAVIGAVQPPPVPAVLTGAAQTPPTPMIVINPTVTVASVPSAGQVNVMGAAGPLMGRKLRAGAARRR